MELKQNCFCQDLLYWALFRTSHESEHYFRLTDIAISSEYPLAQKPARLSRLNSTLRPVYWCIGERTPPWRPSLIKLIDSKIRLNRLFQPLLVYSLTPFQSSLQRCN